MSERTLPARGRWAITKLETNLPEVALILFADQRRVKQMLSHLLSNAIKFNQPNGRIGLSVELGAAGDLLLTISDSGVGMDMAKRLF